ncbi:MLO-like protein 13 isoform X3 [Ananas comosus]|uniref:MLO-like protein n=1 Tax=Ananas comosus TaxID=4615 RepID=A0A6P5GYL7_ANACO|nr:MLO-like protein 13 isoform X3 [Ananas comosus]
MPTIFLPGYLRYLLLLSELMLLGFISLLLAVFQNRISHFCIRTSLLLHMLPCKVVDGTAPAYEFHRGYSRNVRGLLSEASAADTCTSRGKVPLLSLEALHQLHIFIFVLAVVHVVFCASTMVLGGVKIRQWKQWEDEIRKDISEQENSSTNEQMTSVHSHHEFVKEHTVGFWTKSVFVSWMRSFFKQFYGSVTKSDYQALRSGFVMRHCCTNPTFDFHKYMMRTLEDDFRTVVGISWYLWLFVVIFLLLNVNGWHTYFWLSFLPLILLLIVGTKLEHIITCLAQEAAKLRDGQEAPRVKPSDHHFWFRRPCIVLYLIHFILFQNSFEIAFFIWLWSTYGFDSCIVEKIGYIIPRPIIGIVIQVLCSYSTLPLYAIVTQMGDMFKQAIFAEQLRLMLHDWAEDARKRKRSQVGVSAFVNVFSHKAQRREVSGSRVQLQNATSEQVTSSANTLQVASLEEIVLSAEESSETKGIRQNEA